MIALVQGTVLQIEEKSVTVLVSGIGLRVNVPRPEQYQAGSTTTLHTHLHWNQDQGPLLVGFNSELEKRVFLLIIECPKIGPSIALGILSQIDAQNFLELIATQNSKGLSKLHGIGPKKVEQMIIELKSKIAKLFSSGIVTHSTNNEHFLSLQQVSDVLLSLNYSKQEIGQAIGYIENKQSGPTATFDQLLRSALSFLSGNIAS